MAGESKPQLYFDFEITNYQNITYFFMQLTCQTDINLKTDNSDTRVTAEFLQLCDQRWQKASLNLTSRYNLFFMQLSSFRPSSSKEELWHVTSLQPQPALKGFKLHQDEN